MRLFISFSLLLLLAPFSTAALERAFVLPESFSETVEEVPVVAQPDPAPPLVLEPEPLPVPEVEPLPPAPPPEQAAEIATPPPTVAAVQAAVQPTSGLPAAVDFLRAQGARDPEWAAMALVAAGQDASGLPVSSSQDGLATDLTRRILALLAVGRDPSALVETLESLVQDSHLGTNSFINDDIFGVLALCAAGRSSSSQPLQSLVQYVLDKQKGDGGWGVTVTAGSDVDDTSAAIEALTCAGSETAAVQRGLAYLRSQQRSDGGFPFRKPAASNSASTAWALHALVATGASLEQWHVNGESPLGALESFQNDDGGFRWQSGSGPSTVLLTSYAVIAVSGKFLPVVRFSPPTPLPDPVPPPPPPPVDAVPPPPPPAVVAPPAAPEPPTAPAPVPPPEPVPSPASKPAVVVAPEPPVIAEPSATPDDTASAPPARPLNGLVRGVSQELPNTGPGLLDWLIAGIGLMAVAAGALGLLHSRKQRILN